MAPAYLNLGVGVVLTSCKTARFSKRPLGLDSHLTSKALSTVRVPSAPLNFQAVGGAVGEPIRFGVPRFGPSKTVARGPLVMESHTSPSRRRLQAFAGFMSSLAARDELTSDRTFTRSGIRAMAYRSWLITRLAALIRIPSIASVVRFSQSPGSFWSGRNIGAVANRKGMPFHHVFRAGGVRLSRFCTLL